MPKNALRMAAVVLAMLPLSAFAEEVVPSPAPSPATETAATGNDAPAAETAPSGGESTATISELLEQDKADKTARKKALRGGLAPAAGDESSNAGENGSNNDPKPGFFSRIIPASFKTAESTPHLEHHGYFRTRLSYFGNYDLDTRGTSPVPAPMDSEQRGSHQQEYIKAGESDAHFGGNLRFRYQPTFHITESARIHATFDILDNFTLGTTPAGLINNWGSNSFFSFNGAVDASTENAGSYLLSVKGLYGEVDTLIGTFRAGRVPTHWGLGMVYNDGGQFKRDRQILEGHGWSCTDCDSVDAVDKVEWVIRDPFVDVLYLSFSWDFVNSGIASSYHSIQDPFGQAFDLDETDDVLQFTISVFDRPISQREIDERYRRLYEKRQWTADWGAFFSYRKQDQAADPSTIAAGNGAGAMYTLYDKQAEAYIFDAWGRFMIPLPADVMMRVEAEFAGAVGSVAKDQAENGKGRNIMQFGAAVEADITWKDLNTGLKTGFAWADNMVYSGHPLIETSSNVPLGSIFRFDANYTIDQIMFKDLMGGINNAWYINLYGDYKFPLELNQIATALGAHLDISTSLALNKEATPGESLWYGFEADLKLYYEEADRFRFEIGASILAPGAAWTRNPGSLYPVLPASNVYEDDISASDVYEPGVAWGVYAAGIWMF